MSAKSRGAPAPKQDPKRFFAPITYDRRQLIAVESEKCFYYPPGLRCPACNVAHKTEPEYRLHVLAKHPLRCLGPRVSENPSNTRVVNCKDVEFPSEQSLRNHCETWHRDGSAESEPIKCLFDDACDFTSRNRAIANNHGKVHYELWDQKKRVRIADDEPTPPAKVVKTSEPVGVAVVVPTASASAPTALPAGAVDPAQQERLLNDAIGHYQRVIDEFAALCRAHDECVADNAARGAEIDKLSALVEANSAKATAAFLCRISLKQ